MYLFVFLVYLVICANILLYSHAIDTPGTVPKSLQVPIHQTSDQSSGRPSARCWRWGGGVTYRTLFPPKNSSGSGRMVQRALSEESIFSWMYRGKRKLTKFAYVDCTMCLCPPHLPFHLWEKKLRYIFCLVKPEHSSFEKLNIFSYGTCNVSCSSLDLFFLPEDSFSVPEYLKVPRRESLYRSDFHDFCNVKSLWGGDFEVKIKLFYKYIAEIPDAFDQSNFKEDFFSFCKKKFSRTFWDHFPVSIAIFFLIFDVLGTWKILTS